VFFSILHSNPTLLKLRNISRTPSFVFPSKTTSSANLRLFMYSPSIFIPNFLSFQSSLRNISSNTLINKLGDSGSPCLIPLPILNTWPFTSVLTYALAFWYITLIIETHFLGIPWFAIACMFNRIECPTETYEYEVHLNFIFVCLFNQLIQSEYVVYS